MAERVDTHQPPDDEPCYVISIAARMVGMHQQTLRYYERAGLIEPRRTSGNIRMYSNQDIHRIRREQPEQPGYHQRNADQCRNHQQQSPDDVLSHARTPVVAKGGRRLATRPRLSLQGVARAS